ncbi:MAG TPA: PAS domain S-box protein, partial [Thermoanaerobaculia bacterium]|nr:PAS domain S-box protein [Thermoanaerobaculia bacterium]
MEIRNHLRLLVPALLVGLITVAKLSRPEVFVGHAPVLAFFAAILASGALGGMLGGLLATLLSTLAGWFFFFAPVRSFEIGPGDAVRIIIFVLEGIAISLGAAFLDRRGRQLARSREALEEGKRTLETLVGVAPAAIVATEPDGRIFLFNDACEKLTGYERQEVLGRSLIETMVPPSWRETVIERFADIRSPALQEPHDNPWVTKTGEERLIEWRCLPISRPAGAGVLGAGIDVTERRRAEQQKAEALEQEEDRRRRAERENLEKDLFVASVSHELRTPLTSIIGWSDLIEMAQGDPEIAAKGIRAIRSAAQTQLRLVNDLLDLSRVREGKLELRRTIVDFVPIVEEVTTTLSPAAAQKNLDLEVSLKVPSAL